MHALRDYQVRNVNEILACLHRGDKGTLYVLPTGGGKTIVFSQVTRILTELGRRVAIFVHRRELLHQASTALSRSGVIHDLVMPGHELGRATVQVASIDTVLARFEAYQPWLGGLDLAVWDEAHHVVAGKWRRLIAAVGGQHLGVTATPFRSDGRGLGETFTMAVQGPSIRELIDLGYLAAPRVFAPPVRIDLSRVRRRGGDYSPLDLAQAVNTTQFSRTAVACYKRLVPGSSCVVFCASVSHARDVAMEFQAAGVAAEAIDGTLGDGERRRILEALGGGRIRVLTSCDLVSEGTDLPGVGTALLLRPTLSTGLYLQQVGRVLRPFPGKEGAAIIDLAGNSRTHGLPEEDRQWCLQKGIRKRDPSTTRRCRLCARVHAWSESCPGCGTRYPATSSPVRENDSAGVAGFSPERIRTMSHRTLRQIGRSREDWEKIASIRGLSRGWTELHLDRAVPRSQAR
ncbi:MAG: DEAD/DEAH box helicase [Alphaproteobacteria bacterium]